MGDETHETVDPVWIRGALEPRFTRRSFIRSAGMGMGAVTLAGLLAACRDEGGGAGEAGTAPGPSNPFSGSPDGTLRFANWPIYIDKAKDAEGVVYRPSLREFTKRTGIEVDYQEVIQDYPSFLGKLVPQLQAGQPTGWDIIVMGGRDLTVLLQNDWLVPLDQAPRPNFEAHATDFARDPDFDPGNRYTMAWQGGLTSIGLNNELLGAPVTKLDDLANVDIVGKSSVGMISSEMPDFVMRNLGIEPATSQPAEWKEAADWLLMQRESGTVRSYYGQNYIDDLTNGNLAATMSWSGDVLYYSVWGGLPELEFVLPEGGGLRWIDNMTIPVGAAHPVDAITLMDFVYDPEIATMITEWVLTMSPVAETQDMVRRDGREAVEKGAKGYGNKLLETASSRFTFPDAGVLSATSFARDLTTDEERDEWDSIFLPVSES
jgi:spermidine/putrescine transport system substrate-binding protein